jgi:hypothetical protein
MRWEPCFGSKKFWLLNKYVRFPPKADIRGYRAGI